MADVSGAIVAVAAGRGVIRGGGPRLMSRGESGRMVSLVSGATVGVGKVVRGGAVLRGIVGGVALGTEAVATGVGLILTGIDAEGRVVGVAEIAGVGVAAAAAAVGDGRVLGEAEATAVGVAEIAAVAAGVGVARVLGEAEATALGVAEIAAVAAGVGVALWAGVALGAFVAAVVGLTAAAGVIATVAAGVAEVAVVGAVVAAVSAGGTNFFGGALGGGVASVLILVRARSAAERSEIDVQPLSTFTSATRSFTRRGRKIFRTSFRTGTETVNSPPLTRA